MATNIDDVKNYCKNKNSEFLSKVFKTVDDKYNFKCSICGKEFITTYSKFKGRNKIQCTDCGRKMIGDKLRTDISELELLFCKNGLKILNMSDFKNIKTKLHVLMDYGYKGITTYNQQKNGCSIDLFSTTNPYTLENIKIWINLNNKKYEILSKMYINSSEKLTFKCLICDSEFCTPWCSIISGSGCPYCSGHKVNMTNCLATTHTELVEEWHYSNNKLTPYNVSKGSEKIIKWICKKCGQIYKMNITNRTLHGCGCPKCNKSVGMLKVFNWLDANKVEYIPEYRFKDCKNKRPLPFDAYLKNYNICIEYDGEFHYKKTTLGNDLERQNLHDNIKNEYCIKNNIKLLRIPYWDIKIIDDILRKEIKL